MRAFGKSPATYEDLAKVPDTMVAELIQGELFASPRPAVAHAHASSILNVELGGPFGRGRGGPGGWWLLFEPELHLGSDVLVPDLAGWRRERLPVLEDATALALAPDWVCEVVTPRTARLDRVRKLPVYAARGVQHAWIVDPDARTLEVFRSQSGTWLLIATCGGDDRVRAEPFDAIELELGALWLPEAAP